MIGNIELIKVLGISNLSDIITKHVARYVIESRGIGIHLQFEEGRHADAPEVAI